MAYLRLNISNLCNFSCKYCHVFKIVENKLPMNMMSYETMEESIENFLKIAKSYGDTFLTLSIYGGETLINKKNLFKIIEKYNDTYKGVRINWLLNTNGSLLTEEMADFFKKYDIDIHLSADGFEETHNKNRTDKFGKPTFERVEKALTIIRQKGLRAQINSFIFPENIDKLYELVELAKKFGINRIYLDLFYDTKNRALPPSLVSQKYFEAYKYGLKNNVFISGPWSAVLRKHNAEDYQHHKVPSVNVTVDGRFFFSRYPTLDAFDLKQLNYEDFKKNYANLSQKFSKIINNSCKSCFLKESCDGMMISQFQYHTKLDNGWDDSCESAKEIIKQIKDYTNKPENKTIGMNNTNLVNKRQGYKLYQVNITYRCNKDCSYCYAKDLKEDYHKDMSMEDFVTLLEWFKKNNITGFNILGGEPTLHPLVGDMLSLAKQENFKVIVFTNGLFPASFLKSVQYAESFLINYNHPDTYTKEEYGLLHKNMDYLKQSNKPIMLAFNITNKIRSCDYVIEAAKKYAVKSVNLDFIIPNSLMNNEHIPITSFGKYKKRLGKFLKQFKENNIRVRVTRPLPKCVFKDEINNHKDVLYSSCSVGYGVISINPDLSIFPCLSIFFKGPRITNFQTFKEAMTFYQDAITDVKWKRHLYPSCKSCVYFLRKKCQGGCLCYKCSPFNLINKEHYNIYSQYEISELKTFIQSVDKAISQLNKTFGSPEQKIKIYVFKNKQDMLYYSGVYHYPGWVSGFASKNTYYQYDIKIGGRIIHELCHVYINQKKNGEIPLWLEEGFCEYLTYKDEKDERLREILKKKEIILFDKLFARDKLSLLKHDSDPLDKNIAYIQSRSLVSHLISKFGTDVIMKLLKGDYKDFRQCFFELTGSKFEYEENTWLKKIIEQSSE